MNNLAQKICELDCPFGLPTGHRIADHPAAAPQEPAPGGEATAREMLCKCKTFILNPAERAYLDGCDFVHTEMGCLDEKVTAYDTLAAQVERLEKALRRCSDAARAAAGWLADVPGAAPIKDDLLREYEAARAVLGESK